MNIFPTEAQAELPESPYTPVQQAFMEAVAAGAFPQINYYFSINDYFSLNSSGDFENTDTYVAFKIFEAGYIYRNAQDELVKATLADEQFEDEVLAAVSGHEPSKPLISKKLKDFLILMAVLLIGAVIGYFTNFAHLNSKIHF